MNIDKFISGYIEGRINTLNQIIKADDMLYKVGAILSPFQGGGLFDFFDTPNEDLKELIHDSIVYSKMSGPARLYAHIRHPFYIKKVKDYYNKTIASRMVKRLLAEQYIKKNLIPQVLNQLDEEDRLEEYESLTKEKKKILDTIDEELDD